MRRDVGDEICMKPLRILVCTSIVIFVLSLRFSAHTEDKIRIGISGLSSGFVPTIIAEKKGYYAKYGLQSEHVLISLAIAINAMGTGDLDYVISLAQGISAFLRGFPREARDDDAGQARLFHYGQA